MICSLELRNLMATSLSVYVCLGSRYNRRDHNTVISLNSSTHALSFLNIHLPEPPTPQLHLQFLAVSRHH